jgi:CheY-like chemotaxis protein
MSQPNTKRVVLYIEDSPVDMALVAQLIARRSDLKLLMAVDAYSGIKIAREKHPDVIVMDIKLPDITGFEALGILNKDPETANIPVMAVSCDAYPNQIEKELKPGFFTYLIKPFQLDEFMHMLDLTLQYATTVKKNKIAS